MKHEDQLRAWAKGSHALVAATELLLSAFMGKFAKVGNPWVHGSTVVDRVVEHAWIDFERIPDVLGTKSRGERALLILAASLADVGVEVSLGDVLSSLDRRNLDLVLAAVAHAAGSHEHSDLILNSAGEAAGFQKLASLHPWP